MLTDEEERANAVYRAEIASGIYVIRPLATIHDAKMLAAYVMKRRFWGRHSVVRTLELSYTPTWDMDSSCGWQKGAPKTAHMELTIGSLCEGTVYHELAHLARRDMDNGHRNAFLRFYFRIVEGCAPNVSQVLLPRYARELRQRELVTGREVWLKPWLNA